MIVTIKYKSWKSKGSSNKKIHTGSLANIIHTLDSWICIHTRYNLLKYENISTLSIHDCYLFKISDADSVIKYNKNKLYDVYENISYESITNNEIKLKKNLIKKNDFCNDYFLGF